MDLRNDSELIHYLDVRQGPNQRLALILYFIFKLALILAAAFSTWLGYHLFILGVTGEASLVLNHKELTAQLLNGAPGLFFGIGGIVALIVIAWKGVEVRA